MLEIHNNVTADEQTDLLFLTLNTEIYYSYWFQKKSPRSKIVSDCHRGSDVEFAESSYPPPTIQLAPGNVRSDHQTCIVVDDSLRLTATSLPRTFTKIATMYR